MLPNWIAYIFFGFIAIILLPELLQWWHESLSEVTADLPQHLRVLMLVVFDPLEYIWKWLIALVAVIITLISRR